MLAYFLALAVGLGSFSIYIAAFFFPEVHRKTDFAWSGVGLFYALILWACAGRITGALLLGQMAAVALLGWFAWETLSLRRQVTPIAQQTPIPQSVNLPTAGIPFAGLFAKKPEPAAKKPKFVRSPKPKSDNVPAPVVDQNEVKAEISPVAEIVEKIAIAPELPIPDSITPITEPIAVWSIETPVAETPVESAASNESAIDPKVSEIATAPTVEATEAQPEFKQELDDDDFDQMWRSAVKESQSVAPTAAPTENSTATKVSKKPGGFGSLFGNIKNSLSGLLGKGSDKSKSSANTQVTTAKVPSESIAPTSEISTIPTPDIEQILESELAEIPTPDIEQILESELAEAALEVATETSNTAVTAVEENLAVPFPLDVEAMAELISAETAISPNQLSEMTVVEMVAPTSVEVEMSLEAIDSDTKQEVKVIVVEIEAIASAETPELIHPNLAETAKPADESKPENVSGEEPMIP
ncbi:MAG: Ycf66 family protein [Tychonema bourrellyi B0820]|nr:Ycf66 family protein [Tychonema bourrellyi B0820]